MTEQKIPPAALRILQNMVMQQEMYTKGLLDGMGLEGLHSVDIRTGIITRVKENNGTQETHDAGDGEKAQGENAP